MNPVLRVLARVAMALKQCWDAMFSWDLRDSLYSAALYSYWGEIAEDDRKMTEEFRDLRVRSGIQVMPRNGLSTCTAKRYALHRIDAK